MNFPVIIAEHFDKPKIVTSVDDFPIGKSFRIILENAGPTELAAIMAYLGRSNEYDDF